MRSGIVLLAFAAVAILAGCGTSHPPRFYDLSATATAGTLPATPVSVLVGPVTIPASVDQPQFVVRAAANRVHVDEFNRWDAPLNDSIARVVARDLSIELGSPEVAVAPLANFKASYRVTIDIQRFESVRGEAALIEAVWAVRNTGTGQTKSGRNVVRESVQDNSFAALAAAHSRALARISADIATAIRAEAEESR